MKFIKCFVVLFTVLMLAPMVYAEDAVPAATPEAAVPTETSSPVYTIDPAHSHIGFSVVHLLVSEVEGSFDNFEGEITLDRSKPEVFSAKATIQAGSIDTRNEKRDGHLKGADFFDAGKFPTITFASKALRNTDAGAEIVGDLTIKGVTKEIVIPAVFSGPVKSPMGGEVIGVKGETTINRQDFGVSWNKAMSDDKENPVVGMVVDNNVTVRIRLEAKKAE